MDLLMQKNDHCFRMPPFSTAVTEERHIEGLHVKGGRPRPGRIRDDLWTIVASDMLPLSIHTGQVVQRGTHDGNHDGTHYLKRVTHSRVLIDNAEQYGPVTTGGRVNGEAAVPCVVPVNGTQPLGTAFVSAPGVPFSMAHNIEGVLSLESEDALVTHPPTVALRVFRPAPYHCWLAPPTYGYSGVCA